MLVQRGAYRASVVYAVRSTYTPLTIRTAHRVPRGREQEHTHLAEQREQRASIRKSTHKQERTQARAHTSKSTHEQEHT